MAQFVGLTVLVTLTHPPSVKVRGLVTDVVEQQLTLSKGVPQPEPNPISHSAERT